MIYFRINGFCPEFYILDTSQIWVNFFFKCRLDLPVVCKVNGVVSMKSMDMYILHHISLVVCFSNISAYFA